MKTVIPFVARTVEGDQLGWLDALGAAMPDCEIRAFENTSTADRLSCKFAIVADPDPADLAKMPNLVWIHSLWAGVEHILAQLPASGLHIVRLQDPQMAKSMAEAVLAWSLYLHRGMPLYREQQTNSEWLAHDLPLASERTIGILGLGNLGKMAAHRLQQQDFDVCGWSRSGSPVEGVRVYAGTPGLDAVLTQSDIIVILTPLTDQTRGLLGQAQFSRMKKGASLINFARGPILDEDALLDSLDCAHLDHAVLDVFSTEPLPRTSRMWRHKNITVLPHISGPTNRMTASAIVADNVARYIETGELPEGVNLSRGY